MLTITQVAGVYFLLHIKQYSKQRYNYDKSKYTKKFIPESEQLLVLNCAPEQTIIRSEQTFIRSKRTIIRSKQTIIRSEQSFIRSEQAIIRSGQTPE